MDLITKDVLMTTSNVAVPPPGKAKQHGGGTASPHHYHTHSVLCYLGMVPSPGQSLIVREVLSPKHPDLKPRADGAGRGLQAVGTPGDSGLPSRGHLQMVVLMDPMEDPDDILRAHRSREKSYLFDVAFDFTATQVRGECGLETHRKRTPLHTSPCKDSSQGTLHTFSSTLAQAHTSWSFAHL